MKITHFMFAVLFGLAATFSGAVSAQETTDTVVIQDENGTEITTETTTETTTDGTETTTTVEETVAE